ncbi:MAG: DUF1540 domain-containing protein [Butyricicoccus sp.]|nr:DUF1540 domain-containing protein [Butyricicoccus sp.]
MNYENKAIHCTVKSCANHSERADFCALESIQVGTHECDPTKSACTDCMSFRKK